MLHSPCCIYCYTSERENELQCHSKKLPCLFLFPLQMCFGLSPAPTKSFLRKARTGFDRTKLAKAACSSLKKNLFYLSPTLSASRYPDLCFITLKTCYCVRPLNRFKYFWALFVWENTGFFPYRHEAILFCLWPSEPPMNLVDLLHPPRTHICVGFFTTFTVKLRETVLWLPGQFCRVERLLKSVNWRKHASTLQTFSRHCEFFFWGSVLLLLTSVLSIGKKWTDSIRSYIPTEAKWCLLIGYISLFHLW